MSLLLVNAISEDTVAAPGNRYGNYIVVSVADAAGNPVTGLSVSNFKVQPVIVAPGGAAVNINGVSASGLPGFYVVSVVPINTETWKPGTYVFAVAVESGANRGQNLASVLMD